MQCEFRYAHVIGGTSIALNWAYTSTDSLGAQDDQFGVILDGMVTNLSDPGGLANQNGSFASSAPVHTFAFFFNCGACIGGDARATISGLVVPEPASLALVCLGLAGVGLRRKPRA